MMQATEHRQARPSRPTFEIGPHLPVLRFPLAEFKHLMVRSEEVENNSSPLDRLAPRIFYFDADFGDWPCGESQRGGSKKQK